MGFFNRKKKLNAVASGKLLSLEEVSDDVFSSKMMGNGFAVASHEGEIFAPFDGTILNVFPTKHAITLKNSNGDVVLIHMGIDTVDLKGAGFSVSVEENQSVKKGEKLASMDVSFLEKNNKDTVIVVITPEKMTGELVKDKQMVTPKDVAFTL
ncbi:PTS sugar transporter subunit IIA [Vagococcus carniphilus]|uniref:PTS sugar transporter subunit IIA n=1 Tax=Vagococcus carniphilus TaxID=218144 RepID=UPI003B5CB48B